VHAVPGEQAQAITTTFMQEKCAKFTNRLLKLKYLPIDNLTKIAATKSAIQTLIPYGIYATHPKSIPIKHLQTILNHALKGKTKHWHLSNPITQDERLGPNMPNLEQDYTYEVVTELHRLVNQNNFAGHLLRSYLNQAATWHTWPVNPMDPATIELKLEDPWKHTLIAKWRAWAKQTHPAFTITWTN
jgi:hypothetical protein